MVGISRSLYFYTLTRPEFLWHPYLIVNLAKGYCLKDIRLTILSMKERKGRGTLRPVGGHFVSFKKTFYDEVVCREAESKGEENEGYEPLQPTVVHER